MVTVRHDHIATTVLWCLLQQDNAKKVNDVVYLNRRQGGNPRVGLSVLLRLQRRSANST